MTAITKPSRFYPNSNVNTIVTKHVFLTILAHADAAGVAAGITLQEICDFANASTIANVKYALTALEASRAIAVEQVGRGPRTYRVINATEDERVAARMFQQSAIDRVNALRAKRADLTRAERGGSTSLVAAPRPSTPVSVDVSQLPIAFLNLVRLTKEEDPEKTRYRCDIHIGTIGTVRNCLIMIVPGKLLLYGPGRPKDNGFRDWFEFEFSFKKVILAAFESRLAQPEEIPEAV